MILLQTFLYTCSLLRRVTFKVLPLSSYAFSPAMLETFTELLFQSNLQGLPLHFCECVLCPEIFIPCRCTLILETTKVIGSHIWWIRVEGVVPDQQVFFAIKFLHNKPHWLFCFVWTFLWHFHQICAFLEDHFHILLILFRPMPL